ncbi:AAA family ATPase [Urbifossiella limnaea]|uniref:AAA family ATPase n=1 Tax=Urbifossiella limnaea TaxID=2528023 RepID=A0A517XTC2_9BACT|nr:AAA family ATPase [Urbifossiella limnaea]QDU20776.1 hypothetical protein ETAA1_27360 [Urbifossiella limnaea]
MSTTAYAPELLDHVDPVPDAHAGWLWDGLLARGDVALLTSVWKTGKTTLLAGLLRALDAGEPFLGRATAPGHAVVVSEEARHHWAARRAAIPCGQRTRLVSRPFPGRPTAAEWAALVRAAEDDRAKTPIDLFVVDPLATFLPGRSDCDPGALLDFLHPLRRLAEGGTAVLVLHHPRKEKSEDGSAARGSGVLLGYVDATLELGRFGRLASDANRRRLTVRSRHPSAPESVVYEWVVGTPEFRVVADGADARFRENWEEVRRLLAGRPTAASVRDLLATWPEDRPAPSSQQLYGWLHRAVREGLAEQCGRGTKGDPFRFELPRKRSRLADLPPLPPL